MKVKRISPRLIVKICAGGWLVKSQHERIQRIVAGPFKTEAEARGYIATITSSTGTKLAQPPRYDMASR